MRGCRFGEQIIVFDREDRVAIEAFKEFGAVGKIAIYEIDEFVARNGQVDLLPPPLVVAADVPDVIEKTFFERQQLRHAVASIQQDDLQVPHFGQRLPHIDACPLGV